MSPATLQLPGSIHFDAARVLVSQPSLISSGHRQFDSGRRNHPTTKGNLPMKFEASDEPIHLPKFEIPVPLFKDGKRSTVTVGARCEIPDMWEAITVYRRAIFQPGENGELTQDFDRAALALFRHSVREVFNYGGFPKKKGEWVDDFLANHQRKAHATMFGHLIWANLMPAEANAAGPLAQPLSDFATSSE